MLPDPLLATKLYIPPVRPDPSTEPRTGLVSRPCLIERPNAGISCKLTLVSAPAGFGKTTLVTNRLAAASQRGGCAHTLTWLSIDGMIDDNLPG
jgi:LuxR family maltose regulon positive regulatory protein